jgi:Bacterial protein of unknown function (DUF839)/Major intrinsic protein
MNGITPANPAYAFADQADVVINLRLAADAAGATKMDRPEWGAVDPRNGEMYMTLTNTNAASRPIAGVDAANPRFYNDRRTTGQDQKGNPNGHIIRLAEAGGRADATSFTWDVFLLGARATADTGNVNLSGLTDANDFSSPDGLWFSCANPGLLWIQTDDGAYTDVTNCMMLAASPGEVGDGGKRTVVNVDGAFGPISGAHFNPAVTLAAASQDGLEWSDVPPYIGVQIVGAFGGVAAAHVMFETPLFFASRHARAGIPQAFSEFVATFGLLAVIWGCVRLRSGAVPFAVAAYITAAYWFTALDFVCEPRRHARAVGHGYVRGDSPLRRARVHRGSARRRRIRHGALPVADTAIGLNGLGVRLETVVERLLNEQHSHSGDLTRV